MRKGICIIRPPINRKKKKSVDFPSTPTHINNSDVTGVIIDQAEMNVCVRV